MNMKGNNNNSPNLNNKTCCLCSGSGSEWLISLTRSTKKINQSIYQSIYLTLTHLTVLINPPCGSRLVKLTGWDEVKILVRVKRSQWNWLVTGSERFPTWEILFLIDIVRLRPPQLLSSKAGTHVTTDNNYDLVIMTHWLLLTVRRWKS